MSQPPTKRPIERLDEALSVAQSSDPFAPVTVVVPSPYARIQLRRAVGEHRGFCGVAFRTWGELTGDLARRTGTGLRMPSHRVLDEALRHVLLSVRSPFEPFARLPVARAQLLALFSELWRSGEGLVSALERQGGMMRSTVEVLGAVETRLADCHFGDPGRLLALAAEAPVDASLGAIIRWYPGPLRGRDRAVLQRLVDAGVAVSTLEGEDGSVGQVIACSDPDEEVRVVTRRLIEATSNGVPLWRQAVIHPPADRYALIVHEQLSAARLPTSGPSPMSLAQSAAGRALLGLLRLAGGEWRRGEVIGWLAGSPISRGFDAPRAPVTQWDDVSARAGVVEGLVQWRTRLIRFTEIGPQRDQHVAHSESEAQAARALLEFVERLAEDLEPPSGAWPSWATWASSVLERYLERAESNWPVAESVAREQVLLALDDLSERSLVGSDPDLGTFRQAVESELAARSVRDETGVARPTSEGEAEPARVRREGLPGPVGSGVFVGTPADARGLVFDRVCVVGAADQFLPGLALGAPVIEADLDEPDWPTRERRSDELLGELRATIALSDAPVVMTRPLVDPRTGRELGRSRWLDPAGALGSGWVEDSVASFLADLASDQAAHVPVSGPERLLGELVRSCVAGASVLDHPAVTGDEVQRAGLVVPPIGESLRAASAPGAGVFSRFEGNIGVALARDVSGQLYPTRLEQYATCPRKYLLGRELHLDAPFRPEATEQMEARDRGTLVHEILATYVDERVHGGAPASLDRLLEIAGDRFAVADEEGRCGSRLMATVERANLLRDLRRFFEEDGLLPKAAELTFGAHPSAEDVPEDRQQGSGDLPSPERTGAVEVELPGGRTVRFGGSVDRIDLDDDGAVVVSDYKTGRQVDLKELEDDPVAQGRKLQLPIYALAAKAYLDWSGPVRARYWNLSWDRDQPSYACTLDDRLLDRFKDAVSTIVSGIEAGVFPAHPGEESYRYGRPTFDNCRYCDFDRVCPTDRDRRWLIASGTAEVEPVLRLTEDPDPSWHGIVSPGPVTTPSDAP